jgi:biopolymer transport protein TolR
MALSTLGGGTRLAGNGNGRRTYRPMSEINVTPFVDVMLVLLIIFMVTAPLLTVGVPVDMPKVDAKAIGQPDKPLVVSVTSAGKVFLQETEMDQPTLIARLRAISQVRPDVRVFVRGDRNVPYGSIMLVMSSIASAGFTKVALVGEAANSPTPKSGER